MKYNLTRREWTIYWDIKKGNPFTAIAEKHNISTSMVEDAFYRIAKKVEIPKEEVEEILEVQGRL